MHWEMWVFAIGLPLIWITTAWNVHRLSRIAFVIAFIALLLCQDQTAQACNRCGLFGRKCRFQQKAYYYPAYKQQVAYPQQVINISNVYPQGQSVYSASQAAQLYAMDSTLALTSATRVAENGTQALLAAIKLGEYSNSQVAEVAKLQAATEHLRAALGSGDSQPQNLTLRITQSGGGIQVEKVEEQPQTHPDDPPPPANTASILSQKCAKCHGAQLTQPKGGLYFDQSVTINSEQFADSMVVLSGVQVPDEMKDLVASLTNQDKGLLIEEIRDLYLKGKRGSGDGPEDLPPPPP